MKTIARAGIALFAAAGLVLSGCSAQGGSAPEPADTRIDTSDLKRADCDGVWAQIDFEADMLTTCVDAERPITALEAFEQAGFELEGVKTSDQFFACRIEGRPAAEKLEYEGESYTPDCADFGPEWAWWGLFIDTGSGWEFAMEGASTQQVGPGEAIGFVWQFGDTSEPVLPRDL